MRRGLAAFLLVWVGLPGLVTAQVVVEEFRFGLDNRPLAGHFNHVLVRVRNDGQEPLRTRARLQGSYFREHEDVHDRLLQLQPGETRTLRYAPYVREENGDWSLRIGSQSFEHDARLRLEPKSLGRGWIGAPQRGRTRRQARYLRSIDMPRSALVMSAMVELALDRDPDLDQRQERALLDWVELGGILHLADGAGAEGALSDSLAALCGPPGAVARGRGQVHRWPAGDGPVLSVGQGVENQLRTGRMLKVTEVSNLAQRLLQHFMPDFDGDLLLIGLIAYSLFAVFGHAFLIRRQVRSSLGVLLSLMGIVLLGSAFVLVMGFNAHGTGRQAKGLAFVRALPEERALVREVWALFSPGGERMQLRGAGQPAVFAGALDPRNGGSLRVREGSPVAVNLDIPRLTAASWQARRLVGRVDWKVSRRAEGIAFEGLAGVREVWTIRGDLETVWKPRDGIWVETGRSTRRGRGPQLVRPNIFADPAALSEEEYRRACAALEEARMPQRDGAQQWLRILCRTPASLLPPGLEPGDADGHMILEVPLPEK